MVTKKLVRFLLCLAAVLGILTTEAMGANILLIVEDDGLGGYPSDGLIKDFLEGLGHTVTAFDADESEAATEAAAQANDLVVILESPGSGDIKNEITEIETPMIVCESWAFDEMGLSTGGAGGGDVASTDITIVGSGHYLAAGFSGTVTVLTATSGANGTARFPRAFAGSEATVIATAKLDSGKTHDILYVYDKGDALAVAPGDGSDQIAADIRICMFFDYRAQVLLNDNAYDLLGAAVNYALGEEGLKIATNPDPKDKSRTLPTGVEGDGYYMDLSFTKGAETHTAYFSDVFADVNDRIQDANLGPLPVPPSTVYTVGRDVAGVPEWAKTPLESGVTYYWAVDESDETDTYPGYVWSFTIAPAQAWDPTPARDAEGVWANSVDLGWEMGAVDNETYDVTYNVYWGTVEADVNNGTSPDSSLGLTAPAETIGPLLGETDYYWKVDTVLAEAGESDIIIPGDVWHFTTKVLIPILDADLVGWWTFDVGLGEIAYDQSGYDNDAAIMGGAQRLPGKIDKAIDVDGDVGKGVDVEFTRGWPAVNPPELSVALWVKPETIDGEHMIFFMNETGSNGKMRCRIKGGSWEFRNGDGSGNRTATGPAAVLNEWAHYTAVRIDNDALYVYIDGVLGGTYASFGTAGPLNPTRSHIGIGDNGFTNPNKPFDGLIDDVRLYLRALTEQEIQTLAGLLGASAPIPADKATDQSLTPTLDWTPGIFVQAAAGNELWYGLDAAAVQARNQALATKIVVDPPFVVPAPTTPLEKGQTFYWAVDTVNDSNTWPGDLWSFTTTNWISVDDMETYTPWTTPGNNIFEAYRDGMGNCDPGNGNNTGSNLTENLDPLYVWDGFQSMKYDYDNDGTVFNPCGAAQGTRDNLYSKIEAQVAGLPSGIGTDWTIEGVKALSLRFYGRAFNGVEPMWAQLTDGVKSIGNKVTYGDYDDEDPNAITEESWHEWFIDMADFGVDATNLVSFSIGFGNEDGSGDHGSGTVYFDDFRLYTPVCRPSRHSAAMAKLDFAPLGAPDCVVNYEELDVMADNWLERDVAVTAQAPVASELLVHWAFDETAGVIASDSSGNGRTGNVNNLNGASWVTDAERGRCFDFSGGDNVLDDDANLYMDGLDALTIAVWIKSNEINTDAGFIIFEDPVGQDKRNIRYDKDGGEGDINLIKYGVTTGNGDREEDESSSDVQTTAWQHIAMTWQSGVGLKLYINGLLDTPEEDAAAFSGTTSGYDILMVGKGGKDDGNTESWNGLIDDVRIYSYALSQSEIISVMGLTDLYVPISSPAEIYDSEDPGDRAINFKDYAELVDSLWLEVKYPQ